MPTPIDPSGQFINVTPSDTLLLKYNGKVATCRGIAIGTAGDLEIKDDNNTTVVIPSNSLAIGVIHPISTQQILASNTTATEIVAYF